MMPLAPHAPAAPAGPSSLAAMFQRHATGAQPMPHRGAPMQQAPGAPMPLNAGGHAAARFGHAPSVMPGS